MNSSAATCVGVTLRRLTHVTLPLLLFATLSAQVGRSEKLLAGRETTKSFEIRFRPGSRAAASVDRVKVMAERDLADICRQLAFKPEGRFVLWLYDDASELAVITGTAGNAGFSTGNHCHIPHDNDQTRYHEMVHVVAYKLPKSGSENRSLFFAEGLANALLEFVMGVHVHAVAAFYLREKRLPPLEKMAGARDFYAWLLRHPGFNAYDTAASWLRFLIDEHGVEKVKRYYTGMPARDAFGKTVERLERDWHAMLRAYELRPSVVTLLKKRNGQPAKFTRFLTDPDARLPKALLGRPEQWKSLMKSALEADEEGRWKQAGDRIQGLSQTANWQLCRLGTKQYGDAALRATIHPKPGTVGVQLQFTSRCQGMLTNAGTFVYADGVSAADGSERVAGHQLDLLVVRKGDRLTVYVDGLKIVEGMADATPGVPTLGVAGGSATFENVRIRKL